MSGSKLPTSRSPISQRSGAIGLCEVGDDWTNRISAEKNELSVTPASSSTAVDIARPVPRRQPVDDCAASDGAAGKGWRAAPAKRAERRAVPPKMITSIAPSDAPAETPSVNGVASGLRSSAWKTTPAAASAAPTSAPASTRGSRATKKICASTLSANGIDRSNARAG